MYKMSLNIDDIKNTFVNSIRTYLYPQQTIVDSSISVLSEGTIVQTFYPFSSTISTLSIYIAEIEGSPGPLTVSIISGSSTFSSTISSLGWNTVPMTMSVTSNKLSTIKLYGGVSSGNDYWIGKSNEDSYFYGSGTFNIAFSIGVQDFIYKIFPSKEIGLYNYPVVALDLVGRPRVEDRYLSGEFVWYYLMLRAEVYSRYPSEVDKVISGIDRGIMRDREQFTSIYYITPGIISEMSFLTPEIYSRNISWTIRKLVSRQ